MPTIDEIKRIAQGAKSIEELENRALKAFGEVPEVLFDPIKSAEIMAEVSGKPRSTTMGEATIGAHLSNFNQSYGEKLGEDAQRVGYDRNIAGQGLPGTEEWVKQHKEGKIQQPAKEVPPLNKG